LFTYSEKRATNGRPRNSIDHTKPKRVLRDAAVIALVEDGTIRLEGETVGVTEFLDGQVIRTGAIIAGWGVFETEDYVYIVNEERTEDDTKSVPSESPQAGLPEQSGA